jgi:UDP-N-acetylmuramate dehydrogenase
MTDRALIETLLQNGVDVRENFSLKNSLSFRVDSIASLAVFPNTVEQFVFALKVFKEKNVRTEIIGNGSNLLFANEYFDGAVVLTRSLKDLSIEDNKIRAQTGVLITSLASCAAKESLSGLEFAYGIPATVGGAVYMNAGAYGGVVSDILFESLCYDVENDRILRLPLSEHGFDYRKSVYMKGGLVCLEAVFELKRGNREEIEKKMRENMRSRREKQPLEMASAGSYFKRPEGHFAGKLIEDCGLKGFSVGDASVSVKHAGFIVNKGNASACDIFALENEVRRRVFDKFGVILEREVRVIE